MQKLFFKEMNRVKLYLDILRGKKRRHGLPLLELKERT